MSTGREHTFRFSRLYGKIVSPRIRRQGGIPTFPTWQYGSEHTMKHLAGKKNFLWSFCCNAEMSSRMDNSEPQPYRRWRLRRTCASRCSMTRDVDPPMLHSYIGFNDPLWLTTSDPAGPRVHEESVCRAALSLSIFIPKHPHLQSTFASVRVYHHGHGWFVTPIIGHC